MLRKICTVSLLAMLGLAGCDDDGEGDDDAGTVIRDSGTPPRDTGTPDEDAGTPDEDAGTPDEDAGTPDEDAGTPDEDAGGGTPMAPMITSIEWEAEAGCTAGVASDVTITVTVVDPDTAAGDLVFTGSVSGCPVGSSSTIDGAVTTVTCPNADDYVSTVTVTDDDGLADTQPFTFGICESGELEP